MAEEGKNGQTADLDRLANGMTRSDGMSDHMMLELVKQAIEGLADHKRECAEERREANRQRQEQRAEMRDGFAKLDGSISKIHDRVNVVIDRNHEGAKSVWDWRLKLAGFVIALLIGLAGYLLQRALSL